MEPWQRLDETQAPDGSRIELLRRGPSYLIRADGYDLMSSDDSISASALGELGCAHISRQKPARVLVGGLGMGFTARAALSSVGQEACVEVVELVEAVAGWNEVTLAGLARHPLRDPRCELRIGDVFDSIRGARACYDAILLDVDNGPDALAHASNDRLYDRDGLRAALDGLAPGGALGIWSFDDDPGFTRRLQRAGFDVKRHRVTGSRKGRGRYHRGGIARQPTRSSRPGGQSGRGDFRSGRPKRR